MRAEVCDIEARPAAAVEDENDRLGSARLRGRDVYTELAGDSIHHERLITETDWIRRR